MYVTDQFMVRIHFAVSHSLTPTLTLTLSPTLAEIHGGDPCNIYIHGCFTSSPTPNPNPNLPLPLGSGKRRNGKSHSLLMGNCTWLTSSTWVQNGFLGGEILIGTCEWAVCVRIESQIESALRFEFESNLRIESFQLQWILITKISNYKWSKRDGRGTTLQSSNTLN